MPVLYGAMRSRATRNVWLANEIGLDLQVKPVLQAYRLTDPQAADAPLNTLSPTFLAISPAGAIPVLEDEGFVLAESLAINLYLARKYGGDLGPRDALEEALMEQWALYGATAVESFGIAVLYAYADKREYTPAGAAEIAAAVKSLTRPLKVIDAHLAAHGHIVGGRFSVADINMAEIMRYVSGHPTILQDYPAIAAWLAACQARPAFQKMWAARLAEPA
jgi:glutathione S-transferase